MAATRYQVMYRFMNDALESPVTNKADTTYNPLFEFYTDPDHRIFNSDIKIQNEEMEKQQNIITEANNITNTKHDMLFAFNGTRKILHKKWVEEQIGYVVRDWQSVRSHVGNKDDWSKEFYTLNAVKPEDGGTVVAPLSVFKAYYEPFSLVGGRYTSADIDKEFTESTIFQLSIPNWKDHAKETESVRVSNTGYYGSADFTVATGPIFVDVPDSAIQVYRGYAANSHYYSVAPLGVRNDSVYYSNCYSSLSHKESDVETVTIPGHYEDSPESPYAIKDQYKRIESSPWLVNCTVGSLEAALAKARILIDMIGMENVKIIKLVPFDQFIKIQ